MPLLPLRGLIYNLMIIYMYRTFSGRVYTLTYLIKSLDGPVHLFKGKLGHCSSLIIVTLNMHVSFCAPIYTYYLYAFCMLYTYEENENLT